MSALNRLQLDARIVERDVMRVTPAGVSVCEGSLGYSGEVIEATLPRSIELELPFVGLGPISGALTEAQLGRLYRFEGFLARKSRNTQKLVFHVQGFEELKD